ncbi:MAG: cytochrome c biogenesis protein ResB, partial [Proteobacteria bacterium]|nr:cytochrome c biogenesis protein ResB [Desulfobulbaceae bacterium]MBU4153014.1 cytochrome c biogenesis protein ResB [Pseudomonadota bacterium]
IQDMYNSWWFVSMLVLFSLNLTVCTIERFPHIWKVVTQDNLATTSADRLGKMAMRRNFSTQAAIDQAVNTLTNILGATGWKVSQAEKDGGTLLFSQKGPWTRLGVIIVHISILVIFAGALIGSFYGYKASVLIPEGGATSQVYQSNSEHTPIPLDFTVRCDDFQLTYYDTGMPKEYRSDLVVLKGDQELYRKSIVVNDPMQFGGLTFYQSSYQPVDGQFSTQITNETTKAAQKFIIVPRQENKWLAENVTFGITDMSGPDMTQRYQYKIWFSDGKSGPSEFWINEGGTAKIKRPDTTYIFTAKPRFATGLQVVKDPGVWTVYTGCIMMVLGLIVIFFMSHRRVWVFISNDGKKTSILVSGMSNKNKIGFEKDLDIIYDKVADDSSLAALPQ